MMLFCMAPLVGSLCHASRSFAGEARIAAGDVVDRDALKAFVEGAKDHLESLTNLTEIARLRKALRTEGEWKSGSLFLMVLAPNGTVLFHGDDPSAEDKDLTAIEDDRGHRVVEALLAVAQRGGGFVEYDWDDPSQPDDENPKLSYAVGYTGSLSGNRLVLIGGYAQDLSDVPIEVAKLPRPVVTAHEVVDRKALVAFVEGAANAFRGALKSKDFSTLSRAKNAFRLKGGDWNAGSIYFYVVSDKGVVLFHGSQRHREGAPIDLDLQDVNGVQFVRNIMAAGLAGGGFVEYHFDDPAVEGDGIFGSPKIGYATSFSMPDRNGGEQVFVVGSGIYGTIE